MEAYSALVSLKQELELTIPFYQSVPTSTLTKPEFHQIRGNISTLYSRIRNTLGISIYSRNRIRDVVDALKKDLEVFSRREEFLKHYDKIMLVESELKDSVGEFYFQSPIRDVVLLMKNLFGKDRDPFFCIGDFQQLYDNVSLIDLILTDFMEGRYSKSRIKDMVVSMMKDIENDMEPVIHNEDFQKIYDNVRLMDSLLQDFLGESYSDEMKKSVYSMKSKLEKDIGPLIRRDFQRLYENVCSMVSLLENLTGESRSRDVVINFQNRITDVAHRATMHLGQLTVLVQFGESEPAFKHCVKPQLIRRTTDNLSYVLIKLPKIIEETACINEDLKKIHEGREVIGIAAPQISEDTISTTGTSTLLNHAQRFRNKDGKLVGLAKDLERILDCLTGQSSSFNVLPIIGMAGIGKTTFAKELYDHPLVIHHFDTRAWVVASQEYQLRGLLLGLLSCLTNPSDEIFRSSNERLGELLYRSLKGKRYLIAVDDVWDKQVWDDLKRAFPNDKNGSRVLLTSRLRDVAIYASPDFPPHCLRCLTLQESWELLCSKSFENESCPPELLSVGKQIAFKCCGLPLAIVVVGGYLSKMSKTLTIWVEVAQSVSSLVMDSSQHFQDILALSYNNFPDPLKACFLYMGVFPEDYEISPRKLISLWIAEGFIQPNKQKSLEEIAEDYLDDLISRCIIMVKRKRANGRIKTCYIHDLIRDFCLRESQKKTFLHVISNFGEMPTSNAHDHAKHYREICKQACKFPRLAIYSNFCLLANHTTILQFVRSFFCFETLRPIDLKHGPGIYFNHLLKVLDIIHVHLHTLPRKISLLVNLKFLALTIQNSFVPIELFKLQRLQTCIIDCEFSGHLPKEFWDMIELRHFYLGRRISFSHHTYASNAFKFSASTVMQNLQSLLAVCPSSCTKENFVSMPNLKKLGVCENEEDHQFVGWYKNLVCLTKLENLKYTFSNPFASSKVRPEHCPSWKDFALNLVKLTLSGTSFPWEDMQQLCLLPKLEVLKLKNYAFYGAVWTIGESSFSCLKFLMIGSTNLEVWEADGSHFPSLEHLVLRHCRSLREIPYGIGEAPLLERIELHSCADSAATSAKQLEEEQQSLGNDLLKVYITER